jgi:hypothetical protein
LYQQLILKNLWIQGEMAFANEKEHLKIII